MYDLLEIEQHGESGGAIRLALIGEIDMANAAELDAKLQEAAAPGGTLVLDLDRLDFMDSFGLQVLLRAAADARRDGWTLAITRPRGAVAQLFSVTGVEVLLPLTGAARVGSRFRPG